jgi:hypothetical protein
MPKRTSEMLEQVVEAPWVWASLTKASTVVPGQVAEVC